MGALSTLLQGKQDHYRIAFAPQNSAAEHVVDIFNEISDWWGFGLTQLAYDLHGQSGPVRLRINSPGGDLTQGVAIRNFLASYGGTVTAEVLGLAASSASVILTGADRVEVHAGAFIMIHNPYMLSGGTAADLRSDAEALTKMEGEMVNLYFDGVKKRQKMQGQSDEQIKTQIRDWMNAETWFTAAEAVQNGFADAVVGKDAATQATTAQAIAAATRTQFFAKAKFTAAPDAVQTAHTQTMSATPKKGGFLAALKALLAEHEDEAETPETETQETPKNEPTPDAAETPDLEAARAALEAAGYSISEPETKPAAQASAAPLTEEQINERVQREVAKALAKKAPVKSGEGAPAQKDRRAELMAKVAAGLDPLAKALRG